MVSVKCKFEGCDRYGRIKGLCNTHSEQRRLGRPLTPIEPRKRRKGVTCAAPDCTKFVDSNGLCGGHRAQWKKGQEFKPLRRQTSPGRQCEFDACTNNKIAFGLCDSHRKQQLKGRPLTPLRKAPGWHLDGNGYVVQSMRNSDGQTYRRLQHRVVMEDFIGRPLQKHENVHHRNGDRADNRIENLELWSTSQPSGQRAIDKLNWAREIMDLYKEDEDKL